MPDYAVVRGGVFIEPRTYPQAIPADKIKHENGVPQLRPYTEVKPSFNAETETLDGPAYTIANDLVTATWTKRSLTAQEISDRKDARIDAMNGMSAFLKVMLNIHNRVRTLEGQSTHTMAQFKAAIKALL